MLFLADECCDAAVVRILRANGHDVLAVNEFQERSIDRELLELALLEDRILITEDKDFGWLVYAGRMDSPGVILIRFPAPARTLLPAAVLALIDNQGTRLTGAFATLRPGLARIQRSPNPPPVGSSPDIS